jgi:hypothetical protein
MAILEMTVVINQLNQERLEREVPPVVTGFGSYTLEGKSEQEMAYRLFALAEKGIGEGDGKQE